MSEGKSYHREREYTIGFRVTPEERRIIQARIKASGLTRGDYFRETFNNQQISIRIGKYESDRLSIEIKRLRIALEKALSIDVCGNIFVGYADAMYKDGDEYTIIDFKSSSIYKGETLDSHSGQLVLYAMALFQLGIPIDKIHCCFNFLKMV